METVGRVFAAVPLPDEVRAAVVDHTSVLDIPGRLAPPGNWHLTLRFLGVIDEVTYDRFITALAEIETQRRFKVQLAGYGAFPSAKRATVFWAGVSDGTTELAHLNGITEEAARSAGLEAEERPFHAHLTLSRIRPPVNVSVLLEHELDVKWTCDEVVVYRSHLGGGPARYEPLETFDLSE